MKNLIILLLLFFTAAIQTKSQIGNWGTSLDVHTYTNDDVMIGTSLTQTSNPESKLHLSDGTFQIGNTTNTNSSYTTFGSYDIQFHRHGWNYITAIDETLGTLILRTGTTGNKDHVSLKPEGKIGFYTNYPATRMHLYNGTFRIGNGDEGVDYTDYSEHSIDFNNDGWNYISNRGTNGSLVFQSFNGTATPTINLFLMKNGKVGVGTTTPESEMHLETGKFQIGTVASLDYSQLSNNELQFYKGGWSYITSEDVNGSIVMRTKTATSYNNNLFLMHNGNVGINTTTPEHHLDVAGTIRSCEILVNDDQGWCDYVFLEDYDLATLEEVENYIAINGHLENIPPATEIENNGIPLGDMTVRMMEKIEELTLYLIEQNKVIAEQSKKLEALESKLNTK